MINVVMSFFCFCFLNLPSYGFYLYSVKKNFLGGLYCKTKKGKEKLNKSDYPLWESTGGCWKRKKEKEKKNNFSNMEKPLAETGPGSGNHLLQPGPFGGEAMLLSWKRVAYPTLPWLLTMWALTSLSRGWISLQHSSQWLQKAGNSWPQMTVRT